MFDDSETDLWEGACKPDARFSFLLYLLFCLLSSVELVRSMNIKQTASELQNMRTKRKGGQEALYLSHLQSF